MHKRSILLIGTLLVSQIPNLSSGQDVPSDTYVYEKELTYQSDGVKPTWPEDRDVGAVVPLYMQTSTSYAETDLQPTDETEFSDEIVQKVKELDYDPVKIYEYVKNNIDYIPYYGSKLGATGALMERSANSFDQASLLIAMLRYAGIPCKYVWGGIQLDASDAMNWLGVENIKAAEELLLKSELTFIEDETSSDFKAYPVIDHGNRLLFHHVWVEAYIPYTGTRGNLTSNVTFDFTNEHIEHCGEKMWIPLDPSFKRYENKFPVRFANGMPIDAKEFLSQYIYSENEIIPDLLYVENLEKFLVQKHPEYSLEDLRFERRIIPEKLGILPTELPAQIGIFKITGESHTISTADQWTVEFRARDNSYQERLFSNSSKEYINKKFCELYNKRITLSYNPVNSATTTGYFNQLTALYENNLTETQVLIPVFSIDGEKINYTDFTTNDAGIRLAYITTATSFDQGWIYGTSNFSADTSNNAIDWTNAFQETGYARLIKSNKLFKVKLNHQTALENTTIGKVYVVFEISQPYGFKDTANNYAVCSVSLNGKSMSQKISNPRLYSDIGTIRIEPIASENDPASWIWGSPYEIYTINNRGAFASNGRGGTGDLKVKFRISDTQAEALKTFPNECTLHVFHRDGNSRYGGGKLGVRLNNKTVNKELPQYRIDAEAFKEDVIDLDGNPQYQVFFYLYQANGSYHTLIDYTEQHLKILEKNTKKEYVILDATNLVAGNLQNLENLAFQVQYVGNDRFVEFFIHNMFVGVESSRSDVANVQKEKVSIQTSFHIPRYPYYKHETPMIEEVEKEAGEITTLHIAQNNIPNLALLESRYKALKEYEKQIDQGTAGDCDEAPVAELLNCIGNQYFYNTSQSTQNLASVMNMYSGSFFGLAVASQKLEFDYTQENFFAGPYQLDVTYTIFHTSRINDDDVSNDFAFLAGMSGSAHEHKVFEDMFSIKSLSTMRILRMAHQAEDNNVLWLDKNNHTLYSGQQDRTFIATHFTEPGTDDDIYIIPERSLNATEKGDSGIEDGYILLKNTYGEAAYMIDSLNGGSLITDMDTSNTNITYGHGMNRTNVTSADPDGFNIQMLSNTVAISIDDFNTGTIDSEVYTDEIQDSVIFESLVSNKTSSWLEMDTQIEDTYGTMTAYGAFTQLIDANINDPARQLSERDKESSNPVLQDQAKDPDSLGSDPVDMRTGEFYSESTDVEIPGLLPIVIKRTYSSQQESTGFLGYGWTSNLHYFLWGNEEAYDLAEDGSCDQEKGIILRLPEDDGSVIEYIYGSTDPTTGAITFRPDPKANPELVSISDKGTGAASGYYGNRIVFNTSTKIFTYTSFDGTKKIFGHASYPTETGATTIRANIYLQRIEDIHGSYLTFEYYDDKNNYGCGLPSIIKSKSGSYVQLYYDVKGRVERIVSSDMREVRYFYDNLWNLVKVVDASGKITKYEYAKNAQGYLTHNLAKIIKPDNRILENVYEGEKVVEQKTTIGFDANPVTIGRFVYGYESGNPITTEYTSIRQESDGTIKETKKEYRFKDYTQCILNFNDGALTNSSPHGSNLTIASTNNDTTYNYDYCTFPVQTSQITVGAVSDLVGNTKTIEFNFKQSADVTSYPLYQESSVNNSITLTRSETTLTITANLTDVPQLTYQKTNCPVGDWYHVCVTLDTQANEVNLYLDGIRVDHKSAPTSKTNLISGTGSITLKAGMSSSPGYMDNIGFYSITKLPGRKAPVRLISTTEKGFNNELVDSMVERTYNDEGNITSVTDKNDAFTIQDTVVGETGMFVINTTCDYDVVTIYNYDSLGRVIETIIDPDGSFVDTILDSEGNLDSTYADALGRYRTYLDGLTTNYSEVTSAYYNSELVNKIADIVDPLGNKTSFTYDTVGAVLSMAKYDTNNVCVYKEEYTYYTDTHLLATKRILDVPTATSQSDDDSIYTYKYDRFGNLTSIENPEGEITQFLYDQWGNQIQLTNPEAETTRIEYNTMNLPVKIISPEGNIKQILYDKNANKIAEIDANGNMTSLLYDYSDSLVGAMDALENTAFTEYDIFGNKISVINQIGHSREFEYDAKNRVTKETEYVDTDVIETRYTYDDNGNVLTMEKRFNNIVNSTVQYLYNHRNQVIREETTGLGIEKLMKQYVYDKVGNKIGEYFLRWTDFVGICTGSGYVPVQTIEYEYSTEFDGTYKLKTKSELTGGVSVSFEYDTRGNLISETDPMGYEKTYEYDKANRLIRMTQPIDKDAQDNITQQAEYQYNYDNAGRLIKVIDPNNNSSFKKYDKNGRLIAEIDAENRKISYEYDANGNKTKEVLPSGKETMYVYDQLNRNTAIIDENGKVSLVEYDPVGNVILKSDPENNITQYAYDELNRLTMVTDPLGYIVTYSYTYDSGYLSKTMRAQMDDNGTDENKIDDNDKIRQTQWTYNAANKVSTMTDGPSGNEKITSFVYDHLGRIASKTQPNGSVIYYRYDDMGNLESVRSWDDDDELIPYLFGTRLNIKYQYDKNGNRTKMTDESGETIYRYFMNGLLKSKWTGNRKVAIVYKYDNAGNKTEMMFTGINPVNFISQVKTILYTYDKTNRLKTVSLDGQSFAYTYNKSGLLSQLDYHNNTAIKYAYDALERVTSLNLTDANDTSLDTENYVYDNLGNITTIRKNNGMSSYRYDKKNQLVAEIYADSSAHVHRKTYEYDGTGNRIFLIDSEGNSADPPVCTPTEYTYTYNTFNQLEKIQSDITGQTVNAIDIWGINMGESSAITINGVQVGTLQDNIFFEEDYSVSDNVDIDIDSSTNTVTLTPDATSDECYTYDENGNLGFKSVNGSKSYFYLWDALNRLKCVYYHIEDETEVHRIEYIYNGDGQRIYVLHDGERTGYLYDGGQVIAEFTDAGAVTAQYIHGAGLGADVGSLLMKQELVDDDEDGTFDSVDTTYFYSNHRGDVIDTADENGDISASYRYEAFGQVISSLTPEWGFSSKRFDTAISLSYFGARYYDASIGRFISRDPMEYIDGPNQYIYCANNPMVWIDPFGLWKRGNRGVDNFIEEIVNLVDENYNVDNGDGFFSKIKQNFQRASSTNAIAEKMINKALGDNNKVKDISGFKLELVGNPEKEALPLQDRIDQQLGDVGRHIYAHGGYVLKDTYRLFPVPMNKIPNSDKKLYLLNNYRGLGLGHLISYTAQMIDFAQYFIDDRPEETSQEIADDIAGRRVGNIMSGYMQGKVDKETYINELYNILADPE